MSSNLKSPLKRHLMGLSAHWWSNISKIYRLSLARCIHSSSQAAKLSSQKFILIACKPVAALAFRVVGTKYGLIVSHTRKAILSKQLIKVVCTCKESTKYSQLPSWYPTYPPGRSIKESQCSKSGTSKNKKGDTHFCVSPFFFLSS